MKRLAVAAYLASCVGCVAVRPYERELLAQPGMSFALTADDAIEQHMLEAREASFGGYGAVGGGCGCN